MRKEATAPGHVKKRTCVELDIFEWDVIAVDEFHELGESKFSPLVNIIHYMKRGFTLLVSGTPFAYDNHGMASKLLGFPVSYKNKRAVSGELFLAECIRGNKMEAVSDQIPKIPEAERQVAKLRFTEQEMLMYNKLKGLDAKKFCVAPLMDYVNTNEVKSLDELHEKLREDAMENIQKIEREIKREELKLHKRLRHVEQFNEPPDPFDTIQQMNVANEMLLTEIEGDKEELVKAENALRYITSSIKSMQGSEGQEECTICLMPIGRGEHEEDEIQEEPMSTALLSKCGHFYHYECIMRNEALKCPICREPYTKQDVIKIASKESPRSNPLIKTYGTKVAFLLHHLSNILANPEHRVIVFTQYAKCIELINKAITKNGTNTALFKGNSSCKAKALREYNNGSAPVMLLSLLESASGTNLTATTHVILMDTVNGSETQINAIESQAVARARRIGQTKAIKIVHLVMMGTREEEEFNRSGHDAKELSMGGFNGPFIDDYFKKEDRKRAGEEAMETDWL